MSNAYCLWIIADIDSPCFYLLFQQWNAQSDKQGALRYIHPSDTYQT